jgi:predicted ABC-type ATPase
VLFFLWLPSPELAVARVQNRVREGGHNIPPEVIRRRYAAGLRNFYWLFRPILDEWWLYDASCPAPNLIASEKAGHLVVKQTTLYRTIEQVTESTREEA